MGGCRFGVLLLSGLALVVQAQDDVGAVRESVDPAKAAAVERAVAALKARPAQPAAGLVRAKTAGGRDVVCGGISADDRAAMQAERGRYSLWVATVAKPSGAYLVDAELRIVDLEARAAILERKMDGPWLFVALPEGPYEVTASYRADGAEKAQTLSTRVNVPKTGQRQAVLRFDADAAVGSDMQGQSRGNPFAASAPVP